MINYSELIELIILVWRVKFNNLTLKGLIFIYEHLLHKYCKALMCDKNRPILSVF